MTKERTLKDRARSATKRYLELREPGAEEYGEVNDFLVYLTDRGYVFFNVTYDKDGWKGTPIQILRFEFEEAIVEFFEENPDALINVPIECDEIQLRILDDDKAIIRHVINTIKRD